MDTEVPRSVHTGDDGVDGVLDPLRDPVHGKCNENGETNDFALAAATIGALGIIGPRFVCHVDGRHGDGEPGGKGRGDEAANERHQVNMAVLFAHVDAGLEHERREWNSRDPRVKGISSEEAEDEEDNTRRPVLLVQIEDGSTKSPYNVENTRDPDELLGEHACEQDVEKRQDEGDNENKCE